MNRNHTFLCLNCNHPITMNGESSTIVHYIDGISSIKCSIEGCECNSPADPKVLRT